MPFQRRILAIGADSRDSLGNPAAGPFAFAAGGAGPSARDRRGPAAAEPEFPAEVQMLRESQKHDEEDPMALS